MCPKGVGPTLEETVALLAARMRHLESLQYTAVASMLRDADGDTMVQVEESADEDMVRMDVAGVQAFHLHDDGILDLARQSRCRATNVNVQAIPSGVDTKIVLDNEIFDEQGEFDPTVNYRFTAEKTGYYLVTGRFRFQADDGQTHHISIYLNGGVLLRAFHAPGATTTEDTIVLAEILYLTATQFLEFYARQDSGANRNIYETEVNTSISIHKLS